MFDALEVSLKAIRSLRQPLRTIRARDPKLAEQLRQAASSVALNLSEGRRRLGKDRRYHWSVASGSAEEAHTCPRLAEAWGNVTESEIKEALQLLDRLLAMLWRLTH